MTYSYDSPSYSFPPTLAESPFFALTQQRDLLTAAILHPTARPSPPVAQWADAALDRIEGVASFLPMRPARRAVDWLRCASLPRVASGGPLIDTWSFLLAAPAAGPGIGDPSYSPARGLASIVGLGVGNWSDDEPPSLLMFGDRLPAAVHTLAAQLNRAGTPTRLIPGVRFHAGARPVTGGGSIGTGVAGGSSGTVGCVVKSRADARCYALTCNHVIARLNSAKRLEDEVWSPSARRGGTAQDRLGVVYDFEEIKFAGENLIDAALVQPDRQEDLDPMIGSIGLISGVNQSLRLLS